jgi:MFS transporter, DHA2 family, methylenomycin A resistance protein
VLVQTLGWRSIFMVNVPFGLLALWMTYRYIPVGMRHPARSLDLAGQVLAVATLASATYALISARYDAAALALLLAVAFVMVESKQESPMLPVHLLKIRTLGPVAFVGLLHNVSVYGLIFVLSLFFQRLIGLAPVKAGLLFLPMTLALAIGTRLGAVLLRKHGPFKPLIFGHFAASIGALGLAIASTWALALPLMMIGIGAGITTPAMSLSVLDSVPKTQSGLASGVLNSARQLGGVIGVAVLGALLGDPASLSGARTAEYVAAIVLCAAGTLAYLASRGRHATS